MPNELSHVAALVAALRKAEIQLTWLAVEYRSRADDSGEAVHDDDAAGIERALSDARAALAVFKA